MQTLVFSLILGLFSFSSLIPEESTYPEILENIATKRANYQRLYNPADSAQQDSLIKSARAYLLKTVSEEVFPKWYGTPWDFNGTTRNPREGKIACGYFVNNVITDLGFKIPRVKWSQSASEVFIKKLAPNNIKRFSNKPIEDIKSYLHKSGDGLYLVGLDIHVGFILVEAGKAKFIHSSYYQPDIGVLEEDLIAGNPIGDSDYRVIGKLLSDEMMVNWIKGIGY